jgi:hypothetical protein
MVMDVDARQATAAALGATLRPAGAMAIALRQVPRCERRFSRAPSLAGHPVRCVAAKPGGGPTARPFQPAGAKRGRAPRAGKSGWRAVSRSRQSGVSFSSGPTMDVFVVLCASLCVACLIAAYGDWRDGTNRTDVAMLGATGGAFGFGLVVSLAT